MTREEIRAALIKAGVVIETRRKPAEPFVADIVVPPRNVRNTQTLTFHEGRDIRLGRLLCTGDVSHSRLAGCFVGSLNMFPYAPGADGAIPFDDFKPIDEDLFAGVTLTLVFRNDDQERPAQLHVVVETYEQDDDVSAVHRARQILVEMERLRARLDNCAGEKTERTLALLDVALEHRAPGPTCAVCGDSLPTNAHGVYVDGRSLTPEDIARLAEGR